MPRLSLALSVVVLAAAAAFAPTFLAACTQQTEGQRCDATNSGDSDCETGLVCVSREQLFDGLVDRCCPPNGGVDSCTRRSGSGTGGSSGSAGSAGAAGSAGSAATYTCVENNSNITCSCPDGSTQLLLICTSSITGQAGAGGTSTTDAFRSCCGQVYTGAGGSSAGSGGAGASGTSGQGGAGVGGSDGT